MDSVILSWIHGHSSPGLDALFLFSNEIGTWAFGALIVAIMVVWHLVRRQHRAAVAWVAVGLLTALLPELIKLAVGRARPTLWPHLVTVASASFPSGHATAGTAFYPLLGWTALRPGAGRVGYVLGLVVGVFIGVGRLYLGVHWPSDVVVGWLLGVALSAGAIRWLGRAPGDLPLEGAEPR
jgi:undecaprenyl-diphosphatase